MTDVVAWHTTCGVRRVMIANTLGDISKSRYVALALVLLSMELDAGTIALSKGPTDPADIGSRCAVMAGREDRAYIDCAEQARRSPTVSEGRSTFFNTPRLESPSDHRGDTRRYPLRSR